VFWPLWCLLLAGLNTVFLGGDAFNLYVGLEVLGLSAVALVTVAGTVAATRAALRYLLVSLVGSLCYLMGVALLYRSHGTLDLAALAGLAGGAPLDAAALALMSAGLLLKTALFPLHGWLPEAHGAAPSPVSAVLSGLVLKATYVLLLRLWFGVLPAAAGALAVATLAMLGAGAVLWGSAMALRAPRLKPLVAYSTVAQVGYLFLLFPLLAHPATRAAGIEAAVLFVLAHACAKAAMFLAAGNVLSAAGHDRLADLHVGTMGSAATRFALGIAGISLVGLPPTGGFAAKWLLLDGALRLGQWMLVAVTLAGTLLAAGYVFRVLARCFAHGGAAVTEDARGTEGLVRGWIPLGLALVALALGIAAVPVIDGVAASGSLRPAEPGGT
jgi:formate hydrogenlyase subunit 3/multisubunit Na+/H+ antiporter MnhD subunit